MFQSNNSENTPLNQNPERQLMELSENEKTTDTQSEVIEMIARATKTISPEIMGMIDLVQRMDQSQPTMYFVHNHSSGALSL